MQVTRPNDNVKTNLNPFFSCNPLTGVVLNTAVPAATFRCFFSGGAVGTKTNDTTSIQTNESTQTHAPVGKSNYKMPERQDAWNTWYAPTSSPRRRVTLEEKRLALMTTRLKIIGL